MSTLDELRIAGIRNFGSETDEQQVRILGNIPTFQSIILSFCSLENPIFGAPNIDRWRQWLRQDHYHRMHKIRTDRWIPAQQQQWSELSQRPQTEWSYRSERLRQVASKCDTHSDFQLQEIVKLNILLTSFRNRLQIRWKMWIKAQRPYRVGPKYQSRVRKCKWNRKIQLC